MLYVTTRINADAFTARRCLTENRGPEGGLYLPMRMPVFSREEICALAEKSFSQNVAEVMNLLFNTKLDSWTVEFAIGRYPVRLVNLSSKVTVTENWHNPDWKFDRLAKNLARVVSGTGEEREPTDWMLIASRIAVLFGIFGDLMHNGQAGFETPLDIAVPSGDFSVPMAAWYAREWGLPIGTIVVCCNENSAPWNLLHQGELRTDAVAMRTALPACDHAVPADLERLIYGTLGAAETKRYCEVCRRGGNYYLQDHQVKKLRRGIYVSVVSQQRTESMILSIYKNNGYISDPYTALSYSGLLDCRSRTGEGGPALILAEESPAFSLNMICGCLGISQRELKDRINKA